MPDPESTFFSFYFMLGLLAVVVFFLSAALVGFALFSGNLKTRFKLVKIQNYFFFAELILLV
ncbi:MAG: hypothetical protein QGF46_02930, partial [Planctomycetota bacterium]|nr:hypothetical protein [Planctomycetota bacterium]